MTLDCLEPVYDLVVVGGGVTGAGVFHLAAATGYKVLLVEQQDYSWGTSSRSSKMVHGGLRYLKQGRFLLTRASVKERERLLRTYPGLVTPLPFLMPLYRGCGPSMGAMSLGLSIYSLMAGSRQHRQFDRSGTLARVPGLNRAGLTGAVGFSDAQVDDARLVLRLIFDALDLGGHALNYTRACGLDRDRRGRVSAIHLKDTGTGETRAVQTRGVINATGAFAEALHPSPVPGFHMRPLRGSHLLFPGHLAPLDQVVSFIHPRDLRPVFVFPWQGCLVLGTTDVDHGDDLILEPGISSREAQYLMEGAGAVLPGLNLDLNLAVSSMAGVRPVLSRGRKEASGESREHVIWKDRGLVTVTGGKLTTFGLLAKDAVKAVAPWLPSPPGIAAGKSRGETPGTFLAADGPLPRSTVETLSGRLGRRMDDLAPFLSPENCVPVPGTQTLWAELVFAAAAEQIRHLSDLLLRRVRIGLLLPKGGMALMPEIRRRISPCLDWDDRTWEREINQYQQLWEQAHSPLPGRS